MKIMKNSESHEKSLKTVRNHEENQEDHLRDAENHETSWETMQMMKNHENTEKS